MLEELKASYGRSNLFSVVTTDAGNTSCDVARQVVEQGLDYFAQIKSPDALGPRTALTLCRLHWRCENCTHWTADAEQQEDRRRLAWSRHPPGSLVVSALRMMALCILAMARRLSRFGHTTELGSGGRALFAGAVR